MARARKTPIKTTPPAEELIADVPAQAEPVAESAVEPAVEQITEQAAEAEAAPAAVVTEEVARKPKLVRDSFTMPKAEYQRIDALKARGATLGRPVKKSELLRAGIKLLDALPDAELMQVLGDLASIKTGRPGKGSR